MHWRTSNIKGHIFGKLIVLEYSGKTTHKDSRASTWLCGCLCGKTLIVPGTALRRGNTASCGCSRRSLRRRTIVSKATRAVDGYKSSLMRLVYTYRASAKKKGVPFALTILEFEQLVLRDCTYCGQPPDKLRDMSVVDEERKYYFSGIDRVDNSKGYVPENCAPCCTRCNWMKRELSSEHFLQHATKIVTHQCTKP